MEKTLLCADIGTSSLKAGIVGEKGSVLSTCRIRFRNDKKTPAELWLDSLAQAARRLSKDTGITPDGIVVSGNGPTLVCVGDTPETEAEPFTLLWNAPLDPPPSVPSSPEAASSLFLPRIRWLYDNKPRVWKETRYIFSGPEYLIWKLCGSALTILPEERYLDAYWTDRLLTLWQLPGRKLSPFVLPGFSAGALTSEAAALLALPETTQIYCGAPDFIAALIGTNTLRAGTACDRAGTSEGINVCTDTPIATQDVRTLPSVISELYNAGYLLPDTGDLFSQYKRRSVWKDVSYGECMAAILHCPHKGKGYRLIEETAFRIRRGVETLRNAGASFSSMRLSGGQARNELWNQMKADVLGVPLEVTAIPDAELTGDAIMGFMGMGVYASIREGADAIVSVSRTFEPDAIQHALYTERYAEVRKKERETAE